jgi:hypothetical protein
MQSTATPHSGQTPAEEFFFALEPPVFMRLSSALLEEYVVLLPIRAAARAG